jgi:hypothetical protein
MGHQPSLDCWRILASKQQEAVVRLVRGQHGAEDGVRDQPASASDLVLTSTMDRLLSCESCALARIAARSSGTV